MNNQQVSQVLTFYRINFQFHDPYRFILDGNFIKQIVQKQIDFKRRLQNVIQGHVLLYIPSCLIRELQLLGTDFKFVLEKAREFKILKCKHQLQVSVDQCIMNNFIGQNNQKQYIVCTQDIQLRRQLRFIINCPLMYFGPDQRIKFQDIHRKNLKLVEQQNKQKLLPKGQQIEEINQYKKQQRKRKKLQQKQMKLKIASEMGLKLKNKIAKGPNPLANKKRRLREHEIFQIKKKQIKNKQISNQNQENNKNQQEKNNINNQIDENKKKRIRKRNKNNKKQSD